MAPGAAEGLPAAPPVLEPDTRAGFVVAVDVGGSLTKIGVVGRDGRLGAVERLTTHLEDGSDGLVRWVAEQVTRVAVGQGDRPCLGYGVVVPGVIDSATGTVRAAPNVGWFDVPLGPRLTELTRLPGVVGHDVRGGGLAEWRLGGGVGVDNLLFLPLGTGIAGALVVDGRLLEADGYAGEIGHIRVSAAEDLVCACGQRGCLETVASAAGVARSYARLAGPAPSGALVDAREVAERARFGDPAAMQAFARAVDALAEALLVYLSLLGPELVVVGGGLSGAADLLLPPIQELLEARVAFQRVPRLVPARLGADAGVVGAGLLGWDHVRGGSADD